MRERCARAWLAAMVVLGVLASPVGADDRTAWEWPLRPRPQVAQPFQAPAGPYGPGHRGVDLAGSTGQPVLAVAAGVVTFAGKVAGRGVVVVDHGTERSTYQPVSASVRRGDTVGAADVIGRLQLGGSHCWPDACLHLGRVAGETYLDPLDLLGGGPVRLLPLDGRLPTVQQPPGGRPRGLSLAAAGIAAGLAM